MSMHGHAEEPIEHLTTQVKCVLTKQQNSTSRFGSFFRLNKGCVNAALSVDVAVDVPCFFLVCPKVSPPVEETHFSSSYLRCYSFDHEPKHMTTRIGRNTDL